MTCKDIFRGTERGPSVPASCLRSTANSTTSLPSHRASALATSIGFRLFTAQIRHFDGHLRFTFFLKVPRQHYHQLLSPAKTPTITTAAGVLPNAHLVLGSSSSSTTAAGVLGAHLVAKPPTFPIAAGVIPNAHLVLGPSPPRSFLTPTSAHAAYCHPFQR